MRKSIALLVFVSLFIFSCQEETTVCNIPEGSIPGWMSEIITELEPTAAYSYSYIVSGRYEGQEVFILKNCCPFCGSVYPVYTCDGASLGTLGNEVNANDIEDEKFFWAPEAVQCSNVDNASLD